MTELAQFEPCQIAERAVAENVEFLEKRDG
jgi:hypothetical protein